MAEIVDVVASVATLAEYGCKLGVKLCTFSQAVSSADETIRSLSNDVSLTSTVLRELCDVLDGDQPHVASPAALEATEQTAKECLKVFSQLDEALEKSLQRLGEADGSWRRGTVALEKLKRPFKQTKLELVTSNLDRLKASLTLMLQVLKYAQGVANRRLSEESLSAQRQIIENLASFERRMISKHDVLKIRVEMDGEHIQQTFGAAGTCLAQPMPIHSDMANTSTSGHAAVVGGPSSTGQYSLDGEASLCLRLLVDIMNQARMTARQPDDIAMSFEELQLAIHKALQAEQKYLDTSRAISMAALHADAVLPLQTRLLAVASRVNTGPFPTAVTNAASPFFITPQAQLESSVNPSETVPERFNKRSGGGQRQWMPVAGRRDRSRSRSRSRDRVRKAERLYRISLPESSPEPPRRKKRKRSPERAMERQEDRLLGDVTENSATELQLTGQPAVEELLERWTTISPREPSLFNNE